jgi:hypothetical protein
MVEAACIATSNPGGGFIQGPFVTPPRRDVDFCSAPPDRVGSLLIIAYLVIVGLTTRRQLIT